MSYNLWVYGYANPVANFDPSGRSTVQLIFGKYVDDYDDKHKTALRWTSKEVFMAERALSNIASAYAKAYNAEAVSRSLVDDCGTNSFLDLLLSVNKIDPFTAFFKMHGGSIKIHKLSSKRIDSGTGQEDNTYGEATGKSSMNIYSPGEYDIYKYGKGNEGVAVTNFEHLITHEMGHVFANAIGGSTVQNAVPSALAVGNTAATNGFCSVKTTSSVTWQWRFNDAPGEYFADMFIGWAYGCWEQNEIDPTTLSKLGQKRSDFMNKNMPAWIYQKIEGK
jgi:hypothetical protein